MEISIEREVDETTVPAIWPGDKRKRYEVG